MEMIIGLIGLVILIALGVPVIFSFGAIVIWFTFTLDYNPIFVFTTMYSNIDSFVLLAIPLFIMCGGIMEKGNLGTVLVNLVECFTGRIRGSLVIVASAACAVFGSICGSGAATLSCIGSIMAPKMQERNYPMGVSAAVLCCAAPIGMLIPPSSLMILCAWANNISVLSCFLSTVLPGIMLTILIALVGWLMVKNCKEIPVNEKLPRKVWAKYTGKTTTRAIPALIMPVFILGGIYGGMMTPSEAAGLATVYAIIVSIFFYRQMRMADLKQVLIETATTTGVIMSMLAVIMVLSRIFVQENLPDLFLDTLLGISNNRIVVLIMINIFLVIIGMLMDDTSAILLTSPILIPLGIEIGINPYHMAAILGVNLGMGNITPPTAPFLYLSSRIANTSTKLILKPMIMIILFAYVPTLIVTTYIPAFSLWLPELIMGSV